MASTASRRVVITGMGLISPLGNSREAVWESLAAGRSGVGPLQCLPSQSLPMHCAGEARDFTGDIADFGPLEKEQVRTIRKGLKVMCREIQMGVAAAQLALQDAGLKPGSYDVDRTGAVYGSDYIMTAPEEFAEGVRNCLTPDEQFDFTRWATEGMPKVTPLWLLKYLPNMPASHVAIYNDLRGPNNSITLREASSNLAVAEAYCTIVRGHADIMIAGATGTRLHPLRTVHVALAGGVCGGRWRAREDVPAVRPEPHAAWSWAKARGRLWSKNSAPRNPAGPRSSPKSWALAPRPPPIRRAAATFSRRWKTSFGRRWPRLA